MGSTTFPNSHPILSCSDSLLWEERLLKSDDDIWSAMCQVGKLLARGIRSSFAMTGFRQDGLQVLALIGKGHNGGDALLALAELSTVEGYLNRITLVLSSERETLRGKTRRALQLLEKKAEVTLYSFPSEEGYRAIVSGRFDICIDGLLGMQFRPPLRGGVRELLAAVNESLNIRLRVAVDLPSGIGDESDENAFRADVTFATGIFKRPLLDSKEAGVIRYLDIGFFEENKESPERVVMDRILDTLRAFRPARSEKRQYGHVAIVAGSRGMPGALSMCVQAALQSGVGLVTVFAPESVVAQLACTLPEAMWRTWPETPEGGLALEGLWQIKSVMGKATCLLAGPGMGSESETLTLLCEIGRIWDKPALLDADALRPEVVAAFANSQLILTPHEGEFKRLSGEEDCSDAAVRRYAQEHSLTLVKKGSSTRISDGENLCVNVSGNAALSRGGSGDLLAGLTAGLFAQGNASPFETACRGVYWHGKAADLLAIEKGQVAIRTTDLLDFLSAGLQVGEVWNSNFPVSRPFGP